jgi:hypothetical protein
VPWDLQIELIRIPRHGHPERLPPAAWLFPSSLTPIACFREFDLDRVLGGPGGRDTQQDAGFRLSSEFTFPLGVGGRRATDRLAELRDRSIGSLALGDPFGPNLGRFRGR